MNLITITGYLLGVLGIALSYLAWVRPRHVAPRLVWTWINSTPLVDEAAAAVPNLTISFRDQKLDRLTMWTGKIWNAGPAPLRGEDVRNLHLSFEGAEVFGAWFSGITSAENRLKLTSDPHSSKVFIQFDFLNAGDGAEFVVLHGSLHMLQPSVHGSVIGGSLARVTAVSGEEDPTRMRPFFGQLLYATASLGITGFLLALLQSDAATKDPAVRQAISAALTSGYTILLVLFGVVLWVISAYFTLLIRMERRGEPPAKRLRRQVPVA